METFRVVSLVHHWQCRVSSHLLRLPRTLERIWSFPSPLPGAQDSPDCRKATRLCTQSCTTVHEPQSRTRHGFLTRRELWHGEAASGLALLLLGIRHVFILVVIIIVVILCLHEAQRRERVAAAALKLPRVLRARADASSTCVSLTARSNAWDIGLNRAAVAAAGLQLQGCSGRPATARLRLQTSTGRGAGTPQRSNKALPKRMCRTPKVMFRSHLRPGQVGGIGLQRLHLALALLLQLRVGLGLVLCHLCARHLCLRLRRRSPRLRLLLRLLLRLWKQYSIDFRDGADVSRMKNMLWMVASDGRSGVTDACFGGTSSTNPLLADSTPRLTEQQCCPLHSEVACSLAGTSGAGTKLALQPFRSQQPGAALEAEPTEILNTFQSTAKRAPTLAFSARRFSSSAVFSASRLRCCCSRLANSDHSASCSPGAEEPGPLPAAAPLPSAGLAAASAPHAPSFCSCTSCASEQSSVS